MNKLKRTLMTIILAGIVMLLPGYVKASEMQVLFLSQTIELKEEPNDNAKTVASVESGEAIIVLEETDTDWYKIQSGEKTGYVRRTALTEVDSAVTQEIKDRAYEDEIKLREAEYRIQQYKQTRIWGTIIVVLVVAIFATGIISTIRKEKANKPKEK